MLNRWRELCTGPPIWESVPPDEWMQPMDDRILELLARTRDAKVGGLWFKPTTIAHNVGHHRKSVGDRLRALRDHGYVEQDEDGFYRITEKGIEYVMKP